MDKSDDEINETLKYDKFLKDVENNFMSENNDSKS